MNQMDVFSFIERTLSARGIKDYYMDTYALTLHPAKKSHYSLGSQHLYYLISEYLPEGTLILSETSAFQVGPNFSTSGIAKVKEFTGQLAVHLPTTGAVSQLEFIRIIPRI